MIEGFMEGLWSLYYEFRNWSPPGQTLNILAFFSLATAVVLSWFIAGSRMFTIPICYIVLLFFGLFSNFLGRELYLAAMTDTQRILLLAVLGQSIGAVLIFFLFKAAESNRR